MNMNFKIYDILSSLIPGFLFLIILLDALKLNYDKDWIIVYTAEAFVLGYLINTIGSWLEDFYFFTWGGKPSNQLLDGKGIWKVKFYSNQGVKEKLISESSENPTNDELFCIAMRHVHSSKDTRVDDFNSLYVFSRSLLTTTVLSILILLPTYYNDFRFYLIFIPLLIIFWIRSKQRGYYYAKEVLNVYLMRKG